MASQEVSLVLDESLGFSQKLLADEAQILLDKLLEFQCKEGSTDVSLSRFRGLAVESTGKSIRFAFFQRDQSPHTFSWHALNHNQVQDAIKQLRNALAKVKVE